MVARLIYLLCVCPLLLFAGDFIASVNRNSVSLGETFTLNLTLKAGAAKGSPDIASLSKTFHIHSQQQLNSTSVINGTISTSTTWKLNLSAQQEGEIVIPAIKLQTSEGLLASQPITMKIVRGNSAKGEPFDVSGINLSYEVSNATPYKNEPFVYTIKIASKKDLSNIQKPKLAIDDAIVEENGEPKIYSKVMNGMPMGFIELSYLITPLKAGSLNIPSTLIQGLTPSERKPQRRSFFDEDFEPFSFMQGFERLQPFSVTTEDVVLNIQPPLDGLTPWLPAKSLTIEEKLDETKPFQAGEPFTRVITISAVGLKSTQLPSLNDTQLSDSHFKIYADKPELKDEFINGSLTSYRKEQYTIIPQEGGTHVLPEISIPWWNLSKKEKAFATLPSKTLQILAPSVPTPKTNPHFESLPTVDYPLHASQKDPILYIFIAALTVLLVGAVSWMIVLQKKIGKLTNSIPSSKPTQKVYSEKYSPFSEKEDSPKPPKKGKLNDLNPT